MGLYASYTELTEAQIRDYQALAEEAKWDFIEALAEDEEVNETDVDKMWDVLHFVLTGKSAGDPIEYNALSEFVVGEHNLDDEPFTTYTTPARVKAIAEAVNGVDFAKVMENFSIAACAKVDLYPSIWSDEDNEEYEELVGELTEHFENLKAFYNDVAARGNAILVMIS